MPMQRMHRDWRRKGLLLRECLRYCASCCAGVRCATCQSCTRIFLHGSHVKSPSLRHLLHLRRVAWRGARCCRLRMGARCKLYRCMRTVASARAFRAACNTCVVEHPQLPPCTVPRSMRTICVVLHSDSTRCRRGTDECGVSELGAPRLHLKGIPWWCDDEHGWKTLDARCKASRPSKAFAIEFARPAGRHSTSDRMARGPAGATPCDMMFRLSRVCGGMRAEAKHLAKDASRMQSAHVLWHRGPARPEQPSRPS